MRDLLEPSEGPRALCMAPCRGRTDSVESVASEAASVERSYAPPKPERFQDAYVLTRQVRGERVSRDTVWSWRA